MHGVPPEESLVIKQELLEGSELLSARTEPSEKAPNALGLSMELRDIIHLDDDSDDDDVDGGRHSQASIAGKPRFVQFSKN